jgi:AraC-like DNA-binding protein
MPVNEPSTLAIAGCSVERVHRGDVEIVAGAPANRAFPDRLSESLGICLKFGADHDVMADGRKLRYPRDAVCVRGPGCIWSTPSTGPVGFVSIDIAPALLPAECIRGGMRFAEAAKLPDLRRCIRTLQSNAPQLQKDAIVTSLIEALQRLDLIQTRHLDHGRNPSAADRARDLLVSACVKPPSLQMLADAVGANRFVLLREFRRRFGVPPHAYVVLLRLERARRLIGRGSGIAAAAQLAGFADQSHLTRAFGRTLGISPAVYRRRVWPASGAVNFIQDNEEPAD